MGEAVKCVGRLHGILFWLPSLSLVGIFLIIFPFPLVVCVGSAVVLLSWMKRESTQILITRQRIIIRRGLVRRKVIQINMNQVESTEIDWPIAGKILNYGTIIICCSGGRIECIKHVADPVRVQEKITIY